MRVLNLYAGIGGNRKLWQDVDVTAVEMDKDIASVYSDLYPNDTVIIGDAHSFLLKHYQEFDFIWSSPPCQTHSRIRYNTGYKADRIYKKVEAKYPDMGLYEEILLLKYWYDGKWVVENTLPYYKPLIDGVVIANHVWWSNFDVGDGDLYLSKFRGHMGTVESLQKLKGMDISKYSITNKRQILRNCVHPELGLIIFKRGIE